MGFLSSSPQELKAIRQIRKRKIRTNLFTAIVFLIRVDGIEMYLFSC